MASKPDLTVSVTALTHETATIENPLPWKIRFRPTGSSNIRAFPCEVVDAAGNTVALCATSMAASLLCAAGRATEQVSA